MQCGNVEKTILLTHKIGNIDYKIKNNRTNTCKCQRNVVILQRNLNEEQKEISNSNKTNLFNKGMSNIVKYEQVKDKIIVLRGQQVILDSDVAALYGVETKRVNEAVKNNPDKFPNGYLFVLNNQEVADLKSKISTASWGGRRNAPTAFTESGLYMLATILKSERATQTTIAIIDTFVQLRELARTMQAVTATDDETKKKTLMQRSGELIGEVLGSQLDTTETETEIELNFAVVKIKHKVKKGKK